MAAWARHRPHGAAVTSCGPMRPAAGSASIRLFFYHQKNLSTAPICFPTPGGGPRQPRSVTHIHTHTVKSTPSRSRPVLSSPGICLSSFIQSLSLLFQPLFGGWMQFLFKFFILRCRIMFVCAYCGMDDSSVQGNTYLVRHAYGRFWFVKATLVSLCLACGAGHVPLCMTRRRQVTLLGLRSDGCWGVSVHVCAHAPRTHGGRKRKMLVKSGPAVQPATLAVGISDGHLIPSPPLFSLPGPRL